MAVSPYTDKEMKEIKKCQNSQLERMIPVDGAYEDGEEGYEWWLNLLLFDPISLPEDLNNIPKRCFLSDRVVGYLQLNPGSVTLEKLHTFWPGDFSKKGARSMLPAPRAHVGLPAVTTEGEIVTIQKGGPSSHELLKGSMDLEEQKGPTFNLVGPPLYFLPWTMKELKRDPTRANRRIIMSIFQDISARKTFSNGTINLKQKIRCGLVNDPVSPLPVLPKEAPNDESQLSPNVPQNSSGKECVQPPLSLQAASELIVSSPRIPVRALARDPPSPKPTATPTRSTSPPHKSSGPPVFNDGSSSSSSLSSIPSQHESDADDPENGDMTRPTAQAKDEGILTSQHVLESNNQGNANTASPLAPKRHEYMLQAVPSRGAAVVVYPQTPPEPRYNTQRVQDWTTDTLKAFLKSKYCLSQQGGCLFGARKIVGSEFIRLQAQDIQEMMFFIAGDLEAVLQARQFLISSQTEKSPEIESLSEHDFGAFNGEARQSLTGSDVAQGVNNTQLSSTVGKQRTNHDKTECPYHEMNGVEHERQREQEPDSGNDSSYRISEQLPELHPPPPLIDKDDMITDPLQQDPQSGGDFDMDDASVIFLTEQIAQPRPSHLYFDEGDDDYEYTPPPANIPPSSIQQIEESLLPNQPSILRLLRTMSATPTSASPQSIDKTTGRWLRRGQCALTASPSILPSRRGRSNSSESGMATEKSLEKRLRR